MASDELEEKINKIRLQNEEIKRRYEEVEADKKYAAKQNALVKMVPSDDWPERKEPPEFSATPKNVQKQKSLNKEHNDRLPQHYSSIQDRLGKKDHKFAQGNGPPPDPKYNFLADSEREMRAGEDGRADEEKNRARNKATRGGPRRRGGGGGGGVGGSREAFFKDNRGPQAFHSKEESLPEYEAWRAERNRIDEARINRQKTAEGNWRREWDSNKTNIDKDPSRKGESNRKDSNAYERRSNHYESDYSNRGHGGSRTYHGSQKNHGHQDYRRAHHEQSHEYKRQPDNKPPLSPTDDRTVTASDKSIKVTVNPSNQPRGPVMSVKVNSPSIAGTGRVGPRQKSRVTYSSQSDAEGSNQEYSNFSRQKSFDEKTAGAIFNNGSKSALRSPFTQRKKEGNSKSPYPQKKEFRNDESSTRSKNSTKSIYQQKTETKDYVHTNNSASKPQRNQKRNHKSGGDKLENVAFSNDDALPSEYQPDKSLDNTTDLKVNDIDNIENIVSIVNVSNVEIANDPLFLDQSKMNPDSESFQTLTEPTNEIVGNNEMGDTNCKNEKNYDSIQKNLDHEETNPNDDNINWNKQADKTVIEASQNVDSNLIVEENKFQTLLEPTFEENPNLELSNSTQQIILQDNVVEQNSILSSNAIEEATSDRIGDSLQEIEQKNLDDEIQTQVVEKNLEQIKLTSDQEDYSEKVALDDGQNIGSQSEKASESQEANNIDINENKSIDQEHNAEQIVHDDGQNIGSQSKKDSELQDANNIGINENKSIDQGHNAEQKVDDGGPNISSQLEKHYELLEANNISLNENKLFEENHNSEQIVHDDGQNRGSNSGKDSELQEANNSMNENKSIDQEKNKLDKTESNDVEQTNVKKESIKIDESKITELIETSQNEFINDSGIKDMSSTNESIELNDNGITEAYSSRNTSPNDSGIADDSNEVTITPVNSIIVPDVKNNVQKDVSEPIKSDFPEPTKEICEKTAESCDISSAAPSETVEADKDNAETKHYKQDINETLEISTKDSGVEVVEDVNKIQSSKPTDIQIEILSEKENPKTEESTKVATE